PRLLRALRSRRTWLAFRVLLGITGAGLVILPLSSGNNLLPAIAGMTMFLAAILLPAAKAETSLSNKATELGALVIVNGGEYQAENSSPVAVRLFVGAENIWAVDAKLQPVLVLSTSQLSSV